LRAVNVPDIPAVLADIGFTQKPVFEIISPNADRDIEDSAAKLLGMGWGRASS